MTAASPRVTLDEDLLAQVVDMLAHGESWEEAARAIEWNVADLRRACRKDPGYEAAYEFARREVAREDEARIRRELRKGLDNPDRAKAQKAAEFFARHLSNERRDQTRLEIERLRGEARLAKERAKNAKKEESQQQKQEREAFDRSALPRARHHSEGPLAVLGSDGPSADASGGRAVPPAAGHRDLR